MSSSIKFGDDPSIIEPPMPSLRLAAAAEAKGGYDYDLFALIQRKGFFLLTVFFSLSNM